MVNVKGKYVESVSGVLRDKTPEEITSFLDSLTPVAFPKAPRARIVSSDRKMRVKRQHLIDAGYLRYDMRGKSCICLKHPELGEMTWRQYLGHTKFRHTRVFNAAIGKAQEFMGGAQ